MKVSWILKQLIPRNMHQILATIWWMKGGGYINKIDGNHYSVEKVFFSLKLD